MDILALGKEPISADQPAGSDIRYEPEFEELQAEIDKLSSPSAADVTDWQTVGELSAQILSTKSKDMLVASYLAVSQIHIHQIDGLANGLTVMHDLVKFFWDTLFPPRKRMRGRLGAIEFWIEKTDAALEKISAGAGSERWEEINGALAGLDALFKELLPEPPLLTPIDRQVRRLSEESGSRQPAKDMPSTLETKKASAPEGQQAKEQIKPASARSPGTAVESHRKPVGGTEEKGAEQDGKKVAAKGFQQIRQAAALLFEENPVDAASYKYRRVAAWANVVALPPANGEKTQIPPPPPHEFQNLLDLRTNKTWRFLLQSAEHKISQYIFWFDLNRFVAEALLHLGEEYMHAYQLVCDETSFLIHRLKGIDCLAFSDGTPFADSETRQWIRTISLGGAANPATQISVVETIQASGVAGNMTTTLSQAQNLAKKAKTVEAVELIHAALQNCKSQKESLLWRMALCQVILGTDKKDLALPHFELIVDDIDKYRLAAWDPDLAIKALTIVWAGYASFPDDQWKNQSNDVFNRITKIDPVAAMRIS